MKRKCETVNIGSTGPKGDMGLRGATGLNGKPGLKGDTGPKGDTGFASIPFFYVSDETNSFILNNGNTLDITSSTLTIVTTPTLNGV